MWFVLTMFGILFLHVIFIIFPNLLKTQPNISISKSEKRLYFIGLLILNHLITLAFSFVFVWLGINDILVVDGRVFMIIISFIFFVGSIVWLYQYINYIKEDYRLDIINDDNSILLSDDFSQVNLSNEDIAKHKNEVIINNLKFNTVKVNNYNLELSEKENRRKRNVKQAVLEAEKRKLYLLNLKRFEKDRLKIDAQIKTINYLTDFKNNKLIMVDKELINNFKPVLNKAISNVILSEKVNEDNITEVVVKNSKNNYLNIEKENFNHMYNKDFNNYSELIMKHHQTYYLEDDYINFNFKKLVFIEGLKDYLSED